MANKPAVALQGITLGYRGQTVLEGFDLSIPEGRVFGILGCIGAGKTRILRVIARLEQAQSGQIEFAPSLQGRPVSFIFQHDLLVPWLTVGENLRLSVRDPAARGRPLDSWPLCAQLGLSELANKKPFQLSGGMRKKVNFA